jgi:Tfp pilus assembly protein PilZ
MTMARRINDLSFIVECEAELLAGADLRPATLLPFQDDVLTLNDKTVWPTPRGPTQRTPDIQVQGEAHDQCEGQQHNHRRDRNQEDRQPDRDQDGQPDSDAPEGT